MIASRPPLARSLSLALAVVGGALWGACFGREALPWIAPLALAPLFVLLDSPRAGRLGWLHGTVSWLVAIPWIVPTLTTYGQLEGWLAGLGLVALAAYLGSYHALFAWLGGRLWRAPGSAWLALPALWVALEALRAVALSGFPWNLAAYAWTELPGALPLSAWIGAYGVSAALVLVAAALARLAIAPRRTVAAAALLAVATLLPIAGRWAGGAVEPTPPIAVRMLQPNIANLVAWDEEAVARNFASVAEMSRAECATGSLQLWPESAAWPFEYPRDAAFRELVGDLNRQGCGVLFNSPTSAGERVFNSALLADATAPTARYDKRHLVPFGEYVPLRGLLPFLGTIARAAGDFSPGERPALLPWREARLGPAICFEVIFASEVAELVRAGATHLVTVTNDAWYGDTAAPWQHLRAAQFRAAENRRPLLRAAITGVSAVIAPDGRLVATLGVAERGTLRAPIPGRTDLSPFSRAPWAIATIAILIAAAALLATARADRTDRPDRMRNSRTASL